MEQIELFPDRRLSPMYGEAGYAREPLDFYETPAWVTEALCKSYRLPDVIWEPACGKGAIVEVLRANGCLCFGSDVADYADANCPADFIADFLAEMELPGRAQAIVTNPPYTLVTEFIDHALELTKPVNGVVAMLCRHEYDCAAGRTYLFRERPFRHKLTLTKRPYWTSERKASPRHNFAWFIWDWRFNGQPTVGWVQ